MLCSWREFVGRILVAPCVGGLATLLVGCSVHPLPDDVARVSTVDIVKSIRCEALAGIDSLTPDEQVKAAPIIKVSKIGYDFQFDISETNAAQGTGAKPLNSFLTFKNGTKFVGDLSAKATLERKNLRKFTIIEPLSDLEKSEHRKLCASRTTRANWTYPIAGRIGMDEVVRTYLKLEILTEIKKTRPTDQKVKFTNVVFADDLTFTTHFDVGATTTLVLDAVVGHLKVTNASLGVSAIREDTHSVIVALTRTPIDVTETASPRARFAAMAAMDDRAALRFNNNIRDPRTQARLVQEDEDARTRVAMELYRRRSLNNVDNEPAEVLGQRLLDVLKVP
jgi:hypothetical protein